MATRLYSLYRLYGKRWVRVNPGAFEKQEANKIWHRNVSQGTFEYLGVKYSIRPIPKSEERRKICDLVASSHRIL